MDGSFHWPCFFVLLTGACLAAAEMPQGQQSAEGAAALYHQSLINNDATTYRKLQNPKLLKNAQLTEHVAFTERKMNAERHKVIGAIAEKPDTFAPRPGVKAVCSMGNISSAQAQKAAQEEFHFRAIGFVDVVALMESERTRTDLRPLPTPSRTFVVQDEDGKWYVLPRPEIFPTLTQGMVDEKPTRQIWEAEEKPSSLEPALKEIKGK